MSASERRARLVARFRQVGAERVTAILSGVDRLEVAPNDEKLSNLVKRELHTLKGEAMMLRFEQAGHVVHQVEELLIEALERGTLGRARDEVIEGMDLVSELVAHDSPYSPELTERASRFFAARGSAASVNQPETPAPAPEELAPPATAVTSASAERTEVNRESRRARLLDKLRVVTPQRIALIQATLDRGGALADAEPEIKESLKREIHTLKGETRLMKLVLASEVAARTESLLLDGFQGPMAEAVVRHGLELIGRLVDADEPYDAALVAEATAFKDAMADSGVVETQEPLPRPSGVPPDTFDTDLHSEPPAKPDVNPRPEQAATDYVRVSTTHVTAMTDIAGELLVRHEQLERALADIERITLGIIAEAERSKSLSAHVSRTAGLAKVAAFGREILSTLSRSGEEQFQNALQLSTLQEEIREIRMVRMGDLFASHARGIRHLAREQGKMVRVHLEGEHVTVDKHVLDCLDEPLLHLCRNAVDHGLETPEERAIGGKDPRGEIRMIAREIGGHVQITVSDDGRGVEPERILKVAVRNGLLDEARASRLKREDVFQLMFRPGFSTRDTATDVSGRGVGLDVVSTMLGDLGGSVNVESTVGLGTRFVLRSPISTAFTRGLVVKAADGLYAIPSTSIASVIPVRPQEIELNGNGRSITVDGERIPLVSFSEMLGAETKFASGEGRAVLIEGQGRIALLVDEVAGEREAVRRNLNPFLAGVDLVSGTGMMEGRRLVMFVNLQELFRLAGTQVGWREVAAALEPQARLRKSRVLVVDDSELTRDMLVSLLERLNFVVDEAVDGADALQMLERHKPDLVMTDLDMPVMDGFGLLGRIRESPALQSLPVIVFSTRDSDDVKRRAMKAGANAYLVKAAFRADELNRALRQHIRSAAKEATDA